jgi:hypothetical protein
MTETYSRDYQGIWADRQLARIDDMMRAGQSHLLTDSEYQLWIAQNPPPVANSNGHYDNLAQFIDEQYLSMTATDICRYVLWDEQSRKPWQERERRGLKLLGMSQNQEGGANFKGSSKVVHPILMEACNQFSSRAIVEIWPASGPVKTEVLGEPNERMNEIAEKLADFMNFMYTSKMPGAFDEEDKMLFRLPMSGSCFKKVYLDESIGQIVSRLIEPSDFIVPFTASDLLTAKRFTHRFRLDHNDLMRHVAAGYYRDVMPMTPGNERWDYPEVRAEIDQIDGKFNNLVPEDMRHTIYECHIMLDIPGFEDIGDDGKPTGVKLPYIVTVDRDNQRIYRIEREWRPGDELKLRDLNIVHHKFLPGLGFYGEGLIHLIGGMASAATGSLRGLLDSAAFANLNAGFRSKGAKMTGGDTPLEPGEWREVQADVEDIQKAFFRIPYHEPSPTLFKLLEYLDERAQRFVGTTENMVGEANNGAPVGTTLALIEQGSKQFTAIHNRLHMSHMDEYRILKRVLADNCPQQGYIYYRKDKSGTIYPQDFNDWIDVIPVSDPNIISSTQRIAQAQAVLTLSQQFPQLIDTQEAVRRMLVAMRVEKIDVLLKPQQPDPMAVQQQMLAMAKLEAEIKKIAAETENAGATAVANNIKSLFSAMQAAGLVVQNPGIVPIADSISQSAGFVDQNGAPIAEAGQQQTVNGMPTNTNPMTPAPPVQSQSGEDNIQMPNNPQSAATGIDAGIETPQIENGQP